MHVATNFSLPEPILRLANPGNDSKESFLCQDLATSHTRNDCFPHEWSQFNHPRCSDPIFVPLPTRKFYDAGTGRFVNLNGRTDSSYHSPHRRTYATINNSHVAFLFVTMIKQRRSIQQFYRIKYTTTHIH